mmetsp:Transcript_101378/g.284211  ORF Transcript_101378/g.284211 Transcript_101378/m.284211 type:complete len:204 (-) Transcript_101378:1168-1779(-)
MVLVAACTSLRCEVARASTAFSARRSAAAAPDSAASEATLAMASSRRFGKLASKASKAAAVFEKDLSVEDCVVEARPSKSFFMAAPRACTCFCVASMMASVRRPRAASTASKRDAATPPASCACECASSARRWAAASTSPNCRRSAACTESDFDARRLATAWSSEATLPPTASMAWSVRSLVFSSCAARSSTLRREDKRTNSS